MTEYVGQRPQRLWPGTLRRFATKHAGLAALVLFTGFIFWYLRLFDHALVDDTFIVLNYVRTLIGSHTWGFFPGHPANTATSPLNVLLLSLISKVEGSITESPVWLAAACFAMMAFVLDRLSVALFGRRWLGWTATSAFVFNPWLVSSLGLESILACSLLVLCIYLLTAGKWHWLAFCLGLLCITRSDGLLFTPIFFLYVPRSRVRFRFVVAFLGTIAPWYLFSWIFLGSFVPESLVIRVTQASWQGAAFFNGFRIYLQRYTAATLVSFAYLAFLPCLAFRRVRDSRLIRLVLALGLTHFLAYSLLGVPPFHWYYATECAALILFGMLALGALSRGAVDLPWKYGVIAAAAVMFAIPPAGMSWILAQDHFQVAEMPINTNLATEGRYAEVASQLKGKVSGSAVLMEGEIGTLGYYCDCLLLDPFSDRRWLIAGVRQVVDGGGLGAELYRINFLFLRPDPGFPPYSYILTIRSDSQATRSPHVAAWTASTRWSPSSWIVLAELPGSAGVKRHVRSAAGAGREPGCHLSPSACF